MRELEERIRSKVDSIKIAINSDLKRKVFQVQWGHNIKIVKMCKSLTIFISVVTAAKNVDFRVSTNAVEFWNVISLLVNKDIADKWRF